MLWLSLLARSDRTLEEGEGHCADLGLGTPGLESTLVFRNTRPLQLRFRTS